MKKGFTLIELLAVIVILAIIALIAVPIILGIINDAKKQSNQRSAELYLKAAELAIARENMNGEVNITSCSVITNETKSNFEGSEEGDLNCNEKLVKVDMDGEKPSGGNLTFSNGKVTALTNFKVGNTPYIIKNGSIAVDDNSSTNEQTESFTGTIYRNSTDTAQIGGSIVPGTKNVWCVDYQIAQYNYHWNSCTNNSYGYDSESECINDIGQDQTCVEGTINTGLAEGSYYKEQDKSNITSNVYLKHIVSDNTIAESYVCFKYFDNNNQDTREVCLKGDNDSQANNISLIESTSDFFISSAGENACNTVNGHYSCKSSEFAFGYDKEGDPYAADYSNDFYCAIYITENQSFCDSLH